MRRKFLSEKAYHALFEIGVGVKALISLVELAAGFALCFFSYATLYGFINTLVGGELTEFPLDSIWGIVARGLADFTATPQGVWAFVFLSHGIVKMFLIGGLYKRRLWAYPASAAVFTLFVIYQLYQLIFTPSILLWLITLFDVVLVVLIVHEYRHKKRRVTAYAL